MKLRKKAYRPTPYKSMVVWFYAGDHAAYVRDVRRSTGNDSIAESHGVGRCLTSDQDEGVWCYVWIGEGQPMSVVAHELIHVLSELLNRFKLKFGIDNDEHIAYQFEHMMKFAEEFYSRGKRRRR